MKNITFYINRKQVASFQWLIGLRRDKLLFSSMDFIAAYDSAYVSNLKWKFAENGWEKCHAKVASVADSGFVHGDFSPVSGNEHDGYEIAISQMRKQLPSPRPCKVPENKLAGSWHSYPNLHHKTRCSGAGTVAEDIEHRLLNSHREYPRTWGRYGSQTGSPRQTRRRGVCSGVCH